ncbi:hypothetical protein WJX72_004078 [[Myrmecia] bisecta]|uniref:Uncharacterized protein n=1 Tax=[Myrmecia] bisecta TaxID=41462 RepID=A0AAW1PJS9_9CHLO
MPDLAPVSPKALRLLFQEQQRFLNFFFDKLEYGPLEDFCKVCLACKGSILFTGVGKSGFIAQKISQTLVSTGTKAVFLNPTDALHGDLGIVCEDDVVVCVSKSGATEELLRLVPYAKAKGALLVSVACLAETKLEAMCDLAVHLPLERELCPFDLAPVTSTAIQMLFGDTIAIALMQAKNLTEDQYAMNHPAGRIGKRLVLRRGGAVMDLRVADLMNPAPRTCASDLKAVDAMLAMEMPPRKVTFLPVVDDGHLVGLVTLHALVSAGL